MTEVNYTHILLDAIYEHSKFSSKFIIRESLKAKDKYIDNEEFYSSLLNVAVSFENNIKDLYASHLDRYFRYLNEEKGLNNKDKTHYPKVELDDIGIPLIRYSIKYSGITMYIEHLENIKSIIGELQIDKDINQIIEKEGQSINNIVSQVFEPYIDKLFNSKEDYNYAKQLLTSFFEGTCKKNSKPVFIKNNNIKNLASILGEIWRNTSNDNITYEYLTFSIESFSNLKSQKVNKKDIFSSNFYKYTHTRPQ
jgi:hypothetical protein